jgi:hypothetical protein
MSKGVKQTSTIQIYYLHNGLCVCGFIIEEPFNVCNKFININDFLHLFTFKTLNIIKN